MVRTHRPASHFVGTCIVMHGWFRSVIGAGTDVVAVPAHPKALHCKCTIHRPGCIMRTDVRPVRGPDCVCVWRCHGASTCKKFTGRRYVLATRHQYPLPAATHVRVTGADGMHACPLAGCTGRQTGRYLDLKIVCIFWIRYRPLEETNGIRGGNTIQYKEQVHTESWQLKWWIPNT